MVKLMFNFIQYDGTRKESIMKYFMTCASVATITFAIWLAGCDQVDEFVVGLEDLLSYKQWQAVDYTVGATNTALGQFHMSTDNSFSRRTFMNSTAQKDGDEYKIGSIFIKETFAWQDGEQQFAETGGILAMVKRGGTFNPNGGGWEWIMLASDLSSITGRGGEEMMGGVCNSCHNMAGSQEGGADSVFPHPTEYAADDTDFDDYTAWSRIGETIGSDNPLLGSGHKGDNPDAVRRVYKKQLMANPDTDKQGYPIGTIIVKEVEEDAEVTEITAMVKRGGDFNEDHGTWEWFMLDPSTGAVMDQGADLMGGMCNTCHEIASDNPDNGKDYVFKYDDDPFNN